MENSNPTLNSIKISGSGSIEGGTYDAIKISGSAKISGDTTCNILKCSGSARTDGKLTAMEVKISGSMRFAKDLVADIFKVSGSSDVDGHLIAKEIKSSGSLTVHRSVKSDLIDISGSMTVDADCNAENFKLRGGCHIKGLLNAEIIDIALGGSTTIGTIGAQSITVKEGPYNIFLDLFASLIGRHSGLTCDTIEADDIYLENTVCNMVRGKNIRIGKNCVIKAIEYSGTLVIDGSSQAEKQSKL